ncbi:MAG TPA: hypothetical protein VMT76_17855 [Puia sp.]|nr:hypothetical protein [Puia sp.]
MKLNKVETAFAVKLLSNWMLNKTNSKIVRVKAMQSLFELSGKHKNPFKDFNSSIGEMEKENIPSINARIEKFRKKTKRYA